MKLIPLAAVAVLSLSLAACSTGGSVDTAAPPAKADSSSAAPAAQAGNPKFGATYKYDDGVTVQVTKPESFKPSASAYLDGKGKPVKVTITITNGSKEAFDPTLANLVLQDGDTQAGTVTDTEKKVGGFAPQVKLQPGKSIKWTQGFVVNTTDLTGTFSAGMTYSDVVFE